MRAGDTFRSVAVEAYDRHVGRYSPALARALIAAAGIAAPARALDVGCGPGPLTKELVAILGADAVCACDPSPAFLEAARARLPGVRVEQAPAESLPFADDEFDATLAQLVVNFMRDPEAGVGEMRRVTRPGGIVGAAVWDYGGAMTLLRAFWDAALALDSGAPDEESMRNTTPAELGALWTSAELGDVAVGGAVVPASYTGFEDLWGPLEAGVGPAGAYAVSLAADHRDALKDAFRRRLGVGNAPFELTARAWVVTGRVTLSGSEPDR